MLPPIWNREEKSNKTGFPLTAVLVRSQDRSCRIYGAKVVEEKDFLRLQLISPPILILPLMLFLNTTVRNNVFCARFYRALLTTCFGPDRWPSSGNSYIKYTKATTVYVNGSVEIAA
jgi:hypothetical protein